MKIGTIVTKDVLDKSEHIATFGAYEIYVAYFYESYIFAIDKRNLICGCFEFHNTDEDCQLAHMYVLERLKGNGIGKEIIKQAVRLWSSFELPSTDTNTTYYYIEDGFGFVISCFDEGILTDPPFTHPQRNL